MILILSGIGDPEEIDALGLQTVIPLPGVGKNLQDHPALIAYWEVNTPFGGTFDDQFRSPHIMGADVEKWKTTQSGKRCRTNSNYFRVGSLTKLVVFIGPVSVRPN